MRTALAAVVLSAAVPAAASVEVRTGAEGRVSVKADAPASEILDRLGAVTGMKVVYEGGSPRTRVSVAFEGRLPAEAALLVLQGLGRDYLIRFDRSGTRPELLIVSGPSSGGAGPLPAAAPAPVRPARRVEPEIVEEDEPEEEIEDADDVPAGRLQGMRQREQATPSPTLQPAFGTRPATNYPVSPFAPAAPGLPTVVNEPTPVAEDPNAPPDESPDEPR